MVNWFIKLIGLIMRKAHGVGYKVYGIGCKVGRLRIADFGFWIVIGVGPR
jgi:hypothetical protein